MLKDRLEQLYINIQQCKRSNDYLCKGNDLSYFLYRENSGREVKEYIEPLFGILRNTFSICNSRRKGSIHSKDYLLPSYYLSQTRPIVYIDAGASTFKRGAGGSSQNFFYNFYKKYKTAKFKDWYLWESSPENITSLLKEIPEDIRTFYHYYNRPIVPIENDVDNPLRYVKENQKNFYIIFKLDVDTPSVEIPIFNRLLFYNDIVPDEFYFEYHFNENYMLKWWGNSNDKSCNLFCATNKFLTLRKKGIRAHGWV